jgi:hypothetical protein
VGLKRDVPLRGCYELKHLPAATLACAYSGLDDDAAEQAYVAIRNWMQVRGYRVAGAKREIYLDQMLEIQFPLRISVEGAEPSMKAAVLAAIPLCHGLLLYI